MHSSGRRRYFPRAANLRHYIALIGERWMETSEELARTFQTRKLLIESSIDGIIACDKAGRIMIFNRSMERMLGYRKRRRSARSRPVVLCGRGR